MATEINKKQNNVYSEVMQKFLIFQRRIPTI